MVSVMSTKSANVPLLGVVVGIATVPAGVISMVNDAEAVALGRKASLKAYAQT